MIDIHSHIIPMVDDGSKSLSITEKMFEAASTNGFTAIFATPHYIDRRSIERKEMVEHFNLLKCLATSFDIELFLGNEVFICPEIPELVKKSTVSCLNDSRYLLIELPRNNEVNYLQNVFFELKSMNIIPIIAHPERYAFVSERPEVVLDMVKNGVLFQLNSGSLLGDYGDNAKKTAKKLLQYNAYQLMGSDAHSSDRYLLYPKAKDIVLKLAGSEILKIITEINPMKVINNQEIKPDIQEIKKSFWQF